jgi:hypothetical protein
VDEGFALSDVWGLEHEQQEEPLPGLPDEGWGDGSVLSEEVELSVYLA